MADINRRLQEKIAQLPEWLRQDLTSKDEAIRTRAEDALAAILSATLKDLPPV
ncbi:hypothetical protein [Sphingomonas crocodyli]|uniref:hypothetical protein n=1 Tax=Sphingomonas crocodyli TaxID=1979270 RepID=UPI0013E2F44B|nr:hypothetical protein [Sphingomonas crocodyli]